MAVWRRTQPCVKTDGHKKSATHNTQQPADDTYATIPEDHRPEYTTLDANRAIQDTNVYDTVTATSTATSTAPLSTEYATLTPAGLEPPQTYARLQNSPEARSSNDLTARQATTTDYDNNTASLYTTLNESSKEGPYEVPYDTLAATGARGPHVVLRTNPERPASEYHI